MMYPAGMMSPSAMMCPAGHEGQTSHHCGMKWSNIILERSDDTSLAANGGDIIDNKVELNFDSTATALFRRGKYHYDCILECGERRVTLADNALLTVD